MRGVSIQPRNPGHWDIYSEDVLGSERVFCIRGGPYDKDNAFYIRVEGSFKKTYASSEDIVHIPFSSYIAAINYCIAFLLEERRG